MRIKGLIFLFTPLVCLANPVYTLEGVYQDFVFAKYPVKFVHGVSYICRSDKPLYGERPVFKGSAGDRWETSHVYIYNSKSAYNRCPNRPHKVNGVVMRNTHKIFLKLSNAKTFGDYKIVDIKKNKDGKLGDYLLVYKNQKELGLISTPYPVKEYKVQGDRLYINTTKKNVCFYLDKTIDAFYGDNDSGFTLKYFKPCSNPSELGLEKWPNHGWQTSNWKTFIGKPW